MAQFLSIKALSFVRTLAKHQIFYEVSNEMASYSFWVKAQKCYQTKWYYYATTKERKSSKKYIVRRENKRQNRKKDEKTYWINVSLVV